MVEFIVQYWLQMICGAVFTYMVSVIQKSKRESNAQRIGMRAILRDRIIQSYNHYIEKGFCPIYARENVSNMYEAYHNLGGNGTVTSLYHKLQELPTEGGEQHENI